MIKSQQNFITIEEFIKQGIIHQDYVSMFAWIKFRKGRLVKARLSLVIINNIQVKKHPVRQKFLLTKDGQKVIIKAFYKENGQAKKAYNLSIRTLIMPFSLY